MMQLYQERTVGIWITTTGYSSVNWTVSSSRE